MHIWWARRPLAASRSTIYASLIPAPKGDVQTRRQKEFIVRLSKWENSLDQTLLSEARRDILTAYGGRPRVLDPFAGGGAIPLEALRLGCETYASDYNPVATFLLKCTLEFPEEFGTRDKHANGKFLIEKGQGLLLRDVKKWGTWVLDNARKEIAQFYPEEADGSTPVGFIWARTVPCQNPSCGAAIPLIRQFWLAKKKNRRIAMYPYVDGKEVRFKIVGVGYDRMPRDFDPGNGTIAGAVATCVVCHSALDGKSMRDLAFQNKLGQRMIAVILNKKGAVGKTYRSANSEDVRRFEEAADTFREERSSLLSEWGVDPIPDEPIHTPDNREYEPGHLLYNFTPVMLYGMTKWGDLFNFRQKLALIIFEQSIKRAKQLVLESGASEEYSRAIMSYLGIIFDRLVDKSSSLVRYNVVGEKAEGGFGRQALSVVWDYVEVNPFTDVGWHNMQEWVELVISHCSNLPAGAKVIQSSATSLNYPDNFFDAVFTDPPYYDNVPYADLSDFFYVWLKRTVGGEYPELFSTPLTPKTGEAIAELPLLRGMDKDEAARLVSGIKTQEYFEKMLRKSLEEIRRVLKDNGICILVYAHKSTAGWESLVNSLLDSGLVPTGAWPIHTEMKGRLRASPKIS